MPTIVGMIVKIDGKEEILRVGDLVRIERATFYDYSADEPPKPVHDELNGSIVRIKSFPTVRPGVHVSWPDGSQFPKPGIGLSSKNVVSLHNLRPLTVLDKLADL